jgi:hypothetical protein
VFAPAGTPEAIVTPAHAAIAKALQAPDVRERIAALGAIRGATPRDTDAWVRAQTAKWSKVEGRGDQARLVEGAHSARRPPPRDRHPTASLSRSWRCRG